MLVPRSNLPIDADEEEGIMKALDRDAKPTHAKIEYTSLLILTCWGWERKTMGASLVTVNR